MIKIQFILFGVVTIVCGRQVREYDDPEPNRNDSELEKLLQQLLKQGKLDIKKNSHDDHSDHEAHHDRHHAHETNPSLTNIQTLNLYYRKHPNLKPRNPKILQRTGDTPLNAATQAEGDRMCGKEADEGWGCEEEETNSCKSARCGKHRSANDNDSVDEVASLLNELEKELEHGSVQVFGDGDARCGGNRCGRGRSDRDDDDKVNNDNRDDLRCRGNRCGRGRADDDQEVDDGLRCRGNRCGRGRADDIPRDETDPLRCRGNRCGRGRNGREDQVVGMLDKDRDDLRCRGNRCGRGRDGKDDDNGLRCRGNRCGRGRSEKELRCRGNICTFDSSEEDDSDVVADVGKHIKKYQISDDLDAIVLNVGDLDNLLTKLGKPTPKNVQDIKLLENVDLDSLLGNQKGSEEKRDVEAIVIDMSHLQNDDTMAKKIKNLVSLNNDKINLDNTVNENRQISDLFSQNQQRIMEVNKLIGNRDQKSLANQKSSKILPHHEGNNNVYLPQWLHDAVLTNSKLRQQLMENQSKEAGKDDRTNDSRPSPIKSMFPMTIQQKGKMLDVLKRNKPMRYWRRNVEKNVGVPFELQVQGLGQVNT